MASDNKLLKLSAAALGLGAAYLTWVYKKGKNFLSSIDQIPDTLDRAVLCKTVSVTYPHPVMKDLKLGAFLGHLKADFSNFTFEQDQYDLDITVLHGSIDVTLPKNVRLNITSSGCQSSIYNETHGPEGDDTVLISVYANVRHGSLHFETAE
ncbi:MAG: hypothetical protein Q4C55_08105 [Eubacterium sp.]|nr:hypothetical protein [Eubacterium sp.]